MAGRGYLAAVSLTLAPARALLADRSGRAVLFAFVLNSVVMGSWFARVPDVQARLGLGEAALGWGLQGVPLGSVLAVVLGGRLVDRAGPGRALVAAALLYCAAGVGPALAPSLAWLVVAALAFGVGNGLMDVAMNAEAVAVERRLGRRVIATCHGGWSLGAVAGASLGSFAIARGVAPGLHLGAVAVVMAVVLVAMRRAYLGLPHREGSTRPPALSLPRRSLIGLAALAALVLFAESAMGDWSGVYLRRTLGASDAVGALGYVAFSGAMAAGRLFGDGVAERLGSAAVVRYGLALAVGGLGLALWIGSVPVAIAGFACAGLGLSGAVPALFRGGADAPSTTPGVGVAAVASVGYVGIVSQAPLLGAVAERTSVTAAYGLALGGLAVAALLAPAAFARAARPGPGASGPHR